MATRTVCLVAAAIAALGALAAQGAQAKYVAIFQEIGSNVEEVGGGTLDLTELVLEGTAFNVPVTRPNWAAYESGGAGQSRLYDGVIGPSDFGSGVVTQASSSGGDAVGLIGLFAELIVPINYLSGNVLSETSAYVGATFASLGMTPGTYVWSWGSGDHADTFTIQIGASAPEPSTRAMMLVGFGGLGYFAVRRRNTFRQVG